MASQKASPAVRAPQRRRGERRVAALLAAAAAAFAENGYDAATMTEIAARAGASIGSLYQFFPTKELIADALHADYAEALVRLLDSLGRDAPARSAAALADQLFDALSAFLRARPAFLTLADRRGYGPRKQALRARLRGALAALFMRARPPLAKAEAEIMAVIVLHLMRAVMAVSGEPELPRRAAILAELRAMLRGHLARQTGGG
jgi:AcrR family transcriptional regulator